MPGSREEAAAIASYVAAGAVTRLEARRAYDLPARTLTARPSPTAGGGGVDGRAAEARFHAGIFGQREREARVEARVRLARYGFSQATPVQQRVVALRLMGATNNEVAGTLGVSEPTVHVAHARGLRRMNAALKNNEAVIAAAAKKGPPAPKVRGTSLERFLVNPSKFLRTTGNEETPMDNDLLTPVECCAIARTSMASLYRYWSQDDGPRSFRLGRRRFVRRCDLFAWLSGLPAA